MVRILTKGNFIDFEAPIYMDKEYFDKFCKKLSEIMKEKVEVIPVAEKERWVGMGEKHPKKWKPEELLLLLSPLDHAEMEKRLKRSNMSVLMKQGQFVPQFMAWAKKKGYKAEDITASVIKKYLEEYDENLKRRC